MTNHAKANASHATLMLTGIQMNLLVDAQCLLDSTPAVAAKAPELLRCLGRALTKRKVARHFMNHVRIGDTIALVDPKSNYSYRLRMEADAIYVMGFYRNFTPDEPEVFVLFHDRLIRSVAGKRLAVAA